jgi:hypothetical protein
MPISSRSKPRDLAGRAVDWRRPAKGELIAMAVEYATLADRLNGSRRTRASGIGRDECRHRTGSLAAIVACLNEQYGRALARGGLASDQERPMTRIPPSFRAYSASQPQRCGPAISTKSVASSLIVPPVSRSS